MNMPTHPDTYPEVQLAKLGAELSEVLRKINQLAQGEVDSIADAEGHVYLLPEAQAHLRQAAAMQSTYAQERAAILNALPAHLALLDNEGNIVFVNDPWHRFAADNELPDGRYGVGQNYLAICDAAHGPCKEDALAAAAGIRSVLSGQSSEYTLDYSCHSPEVQSWFRLIVAPINPTQNVGAVVMHVDVTEQVMSQRRLMESEARYRTLLESIPHNILLKDLDLRYVSANDRFLKELGIQQEQLIGKRDSDFFPRQLAEKYQADDERILQTGQMEEFDEKYVSNGNEVWIHTCKSPVLDSQGNITGLLATFWDISATRRAEVSLNLLRYLLDYSKDAIEVIDPQTGRFLDANTTAYKSLGYSREEFLAFTLNDVNPRQTPESFSALVREARNPGGSNFIYHHRRKDGSEFPIEKTVSMVTLDREYLISTVRDITERMRAEEQLRMQAEVLEATANSIIITDKQGTIEWANPAFLNCTGYTLDEVVGKNPRDLVKSGLHDQTFYKEMWETILAGFVWQGELNNRRKDGSIYTEVQTITPLRGVSGEITHFAGIKLDISDKKRLEEELFQARKMESVGRLAGGVAHDFNNILTVISGYTEIVLNAIQDDSHIHADLMQVKKAAERAASVTRQLLAFSRKQVLRPQVLNLNRVLLDCAKMLQRLIGEDIELVTKPADTLWPVYADISQLEQIMMNLLVNARDAMPLGGQVIVQTSNITVDKGLSERHADLLPGVYVCLTVSDTGKGMDAATLHHLFEPFFTTKPFGKGTGLGLATVHGIVKQSGGSILVDSEIGKGTTFKIYLPRVVVEDVLPHDPDEPSEILRGSETILLVEDEEPLRILAERFLTRSGYTVISACNGAEALQLMDKQQGPVDLVLTDVIMPGMNGRELVRRLHEKHPHLKTLYMSGYTDSAITTQGILEKGVPLLSKPFGAGLLTNKVRQVLDAPPS